MQHESNCRKMLSVLLLHNIARKNSLLVITATYLTCGNFTRELIQFLLYKLQNVQHVLVLHHFCINIRSSHHFYFHISVEVECKTATMEVTLSTAPRNVVPQIRFGVDTSYLLQTSTCLDEITDEPSTKILSYGTSGPVCTLDVVSTLYFCLHRYSIYCSCTQSHSQN